ncbi:MAG: DUF3108 domain-containing protein [Neisseria sp.]|nr:DUF3108 domain-containing protein [Neisseria sp.]
MKFVISVLMAVAAAPALCAELPLSAELQYSGPYGIPATMTFTRQGNSYKIVSVIKVPMYNFRFESGGTVSGNVLNMSYYKDIRKGKIYASADLRNGQISYGREGGRQTENAAGQVLDLFSLAWQLAATDGRLPSGLRITNGKRIYKVGGLAKAGAAKYRFGGGETEINRYRVQRGDDTVYYSFAPAWGNIPAEIVYADDGKRYDLQLTGLKINGQTVRPQ